MELELTLAEENYLKAIWHLNQSGAVSTNDLADNLSTKASSVTDMLKRLSSKELVKYVKYKGAELTTDGKRIAIKIIRKHRLWEVFLVEKLHFNWDEVHEIAEQLEHIKSSELTNRLDHFLDHPTVDPHGDPIPDKNGNFAQQNHRLLASCEIGCKYTIVGVGDTSSSFLKFLDSKHLNIGVTIELLDKQDYDKSIQIKLDETQLTLSEKVTHNILVK